MHFWEDRSNPIACIVNGVNRSLKPLLTSGLRGWKKEVSVNLGLLQAKATRDGDLSVQTANSALDCLLQPKGTILLMADEVQHLATRSEFEDIAASLRTFIDSNKKRVRTIFTGSSQDNLNRLFRNQRAAFYNSASIVPFPDMGAEFIQFLSQRFNYLSGRVLEDDDILSVFQKQHCSPAYIVELLQVMVRDGIYALDAGIAHYEALNPPNQEHEQTWNSLAALDQAILKHLVQDSPGPLYQTSVYQNFSKIVGTRVGQGAVQNGLNRLRDTGILVKVGHGQWEFENKGFKDFVQHQDN